MVDTTGCEKTMPRHERALLTVDQQGKEEHPEDAHAVPVPGGAVDENLTGFD